MIPVGHQMYANIDAVMPLGRRADTIIAGQTADFPTNTTAVSLPFNGTRPANLPSEDMGFFRPRKAHRHGRIDMWRKRSQLDPSCAQAHRDAAKFKRALLDHLGRGAGHFVKTVHKRDRISDMQMIAESTGAAGSGGKARRKIGARRALAPKGLSLVIYRFSAALQTAMQHGTRPRGPDP